MEAVLGRLKGFRRGKAFKEPPELPALPTKRPRALSLSATASSPKAIADSSFFQLLPLEIRRRILVEAFGERTLHLDLRLEYPPKKGSKVVDSRPKRHANAHLFHPSLRNTTRPREWNWWSSVCHRSYPCWNFHLLPPGSEMRSDRPALDSCRDASGLPPHGCEAYPGHLPDKCFIGVTGWILACRQAYIEGIDVLYATNRFHIAYAELAICLPRLLPPQRLSAISQVELLWDLDVLSTAHSLRAANDGDKPRDNGRLGMLSRLPQVLPNLRYLYLSLKDLLPARESPFAIGGQEMYRASEAALRIVDATIVQMPRLRECRVALPSTLYSTRKLVEKGQDIGWSYEQQSEPETLWRNIPTTNTCVDVTTESRSITGYWIVHGHEDMSRPPLSEV